MFIQKIEIENFKSFKDKQEMLCNIPNGNKGSGLNIFLGDNNTGKSTLFEAISFIRDGSKKTINALKNIKNPIQEIVVEATFQGKISQTIDSYAQENKMEVFKKYVFERDGKELLKISRNSAEMKKLDLWDSDNSEYKNKSGIDAPLKKLFEMSFIWADTNPNDETTFGATTICGNLLKEIMTSFIEFSEYEDFSKSFHKTFNNDESALKKMLKDTENRVQEIFKNQFGNANIKFQFEELEINSFFKKVSVLIDDGVETTMEEKGSGMQRSVALALLQVYAERIGNQSTINQLKKPFFLFIDEPEICLHPKAQQKLFAALLDISAEKQIFLSTHSPYFLLSEHLQDIGLFIFERNNDNCCTFKAFNKTQEFLFPWGPTWGEVNYKAYKLATVEFHNELYGYLQEKKRMLGI